MGLPGAPVQAIPTFEFLTVFTASLTAPHAVVALDALGAQGWGFVSVIETLEGKAVLMARITGVKMLAVGLLG